LGIDLFRFAWSKSPPALAGELREGKKLLFGVPAELPASMNRDTRSLPGVSTSVELMLWFTSTGASWDSDTTVAVTEDI
jgi:hypothetical protein